MEPCSDAMCQSLPLRMDNLHAPAQSQLFQLAGLSHAIPPIPAEAHRGACAARARAALLPPDSAAGCMLLMPKAGT